MQIFFYYWNNIILFSSSIKTNPKSDLLLAASVALDKSGNVGNFNI